MKAVIRKVFLLARWLMLSLLIGSICGLIGGGFSIVIEKATALRISCPWLLYLLPVAGIVIVAIYRLCSLPMSTGTDAILVSVETQKPVSPLLSAAMFLSTALTHLCGGSAGREGAALQIGGSIGGATGSLFRLEKSDMSTCVLCGMAAVFSALFGTPFAATVFVLEIGTVGRWNCKAFLPCILSAVFAGFCAGWIGAPTDNLTISDCENASSVILLLQSILTGAVCAFVALLFMKALHFFSKLYHKYLPNEWIRIAVGGALIILLTLIFQTSDYNGGGMSVIEKALSGEAIVWAFAAKILFTALTLGAGYRGGEIVPSLFIGATLGCVFAPLVGMNASIGAGIGMVSLFCAVTKAPVASLLLFAEMLGTEYLLPAGAAIAVAFVLSGRGSLYHAQHYDCETIL